MKKIILAIIIALIAIVNANAQNIKGKVYSSNSGHREPLEGATVKWINSTAGTITDSAGKFSLSLDKIDDKRLLVSYIGFNTDTVQVEEGYRFIEVELTGNLTTQQIKVEGNLNTSYIENMDVKTEVITSRELKLSACCDLSGCFGKNASVEVAVTDILTNTKELKVLGLEGAYTQILIDNLPVVSGLNTKYNVTSIPGTLIDKITISKGSNSVIQGYESISGIMNVLLKDYLSSDRLLFNVFMSHMLENQINLNATYDFGKWNSIFAAQTLRNFRKIDENSDTFLDAPQTTRYMLFNKWNMHDKNNDITIGAKYLDEERIGGQKNFDKDKDKGSPTVYGQTLNLRQGDIYSRFNHSYSESIFSRIFLAAGFYKQESYYGVTKYSGNQQNIYLNAMFELPLFDKNTLKIGTSYRYEKIDENIEFLKSVNKTYSGNYLKKESVPGIYSEASFEIIQDILSVISGVRFDYHNTYNLISTPRGIIKWNAGKETVIRASVGKGFRTINTFAEYSNLLASSKDIQFPDTPEPERMVNYGIDVLQYFNFGWISGNLNFDFYRTDFRNKVLPDFDTDVNKVVFRNISSAASDVFQVEGSFTFLKTIDFKLAYKYIDLYHKENGQKIQQPFSSRDRILSSLTYSPLNKSWALNFGIQWFGKQRIPSTFSLPVQYRMPDESEPYTLISGQLTKNFKNLEIYAGVENLLNFTQNNPIIGADDPFGPYFNTSYVWGPTKGREFYFGFRYIIP